MRNMLLLFVLSILCFISSLSYAKTCPPADQLFVKHGNWYYVEPPSGWYLAVDDRRNGDILRFSVAAWGDHVHDTDSVRCHYYKGGSTDHVQINTRSLLPESVVSGHTNWDGDLGRHYHLCSAKNADVNECSFS